ncbi:MAG: hypothetical protein WC851_05800 [Candidatus Shapirobacteria bacterium]|jgi:hypothetical protein
MSAADQQMNEIRITLLEATARTLRSSISLSVSAAQLALNQYDLTHNAPTDGHVDQDRLLLVSKLQRARTTAILADLS